MTSSNPLLVKSSPDDSIFVETQNPVVYFSSDHKRILLRIINAENDFIKHPESYPELVSIMTTELNELNRLEHDESDWLEIMQTWVNGVKDDFQANNRSNSHDAVLTDEDEELISNLQENRSVMTPTPEQIACAIKHLETHKNASTLWSAMANDLNTITTGPKRSTFFWKRTFKRIINRLLAKHHLIEHIKRNYEATKYASDTLSLSDNRLLRAWMQSTIWTNESSQDVQDLSTNCRICLASTSSQMTHLFGDDQERKGCVSLLEKLNYCSCLSTDARIDDGFPQFICMSCSVLLESAYQLKLLCAKTEEKLTQMQRQIRPENDEASFEGCEGCEYTVEEIVEKQEEIIGDDSSSYINIEVITENPQESQTADMDTFQVQVNEKGSQQQPNEPKRNYQCQFCHKLFKAKHALTVHMRVHSGERPYICETCGKGFKTSGALHTHRPLHSDEKSFECQHCPYRANTKNNLKIHDRIHSGIRPYACRLCTAEFRTNSNMQKHMRNIHAKEKTNTCKECNRSFFTRESARKHMVTHTGLKPYKCTHCTMSYSWYNGLKKHVKAQHANAKIPTETSFYNQLKQNS